MDSPSMYNHQTFNDLLATVGLDEKTFGNMYAELIHNNSAATTKDMTPDQATLENCRSGIIWVKERLTEDKWKKFSAVMTILAIIMSEAQAAVMVAPEIISPEQ